MKRYNWFSPGDIIFSPGSARYTTTFLFSSGIEFLRFLNSLTYFIFEYQEDRNYGIEIRVNGTGSMYRYYKNIRHYRYRTTSDIKQNISSRVDYSNEYFINVSSDCREDLVKTLNEFLSWEDSFRFSQDNITLNKVFYDDSGMKLLEEE